MHRVAVADHDDRPAGLAGGNAELAYPQRALGDHSALAYAGVQDVGGGGRGRHRGVAELLEVGRGAVGLGVPGAGPQAGVVAGEDLGRLGLEVAVARVEDLPAGRDHQENRGHPGQRPEEGGARAPEGQDRAGADRVLHVLLGYRGECDGEGDQGDLGHVPELFVQQERREDEERPVPEVDRVGDVADPLDGRRAHRASGRPAHLRRPGPDNGDRAEDGKHGRHPREGGLLGVGKDGDEDRQQPQPRDHGPVRVADHRTQAGRRVGQQAAGGKLPDPRRRDEEGRRRIGRGVGDPEGEACRGDHGQHGEAGPAARPGGGAAQDGGDDENDHRPHEVELLLDRQRPVVLHRRRGRVRAEVVDRLLGEVPVLHVERAGRDLGVELRPDALRGDEEGRDRDEHQDQEGCRQDPAGATGPEAGQRDRSPAVGLADQVPGDQEARDGEEDIHADVAAGDQLGPVVEEDHGHHRQAAQRLDLDPHPLLRGSVLLRGGRIGRGRPRQGLIAGRAHGRE